MRSIPEIDGFCAARAFLSSLRRCQGLDEKQIHGEIRRDGRTPAAQIVFLTAGLERYLPALRRLLAFKTVTEQKLQEARAKLDALRPREMPLPGTAAEDELRRAVAEHEAVVNQFAADLRQTAEMCGPLPTEIDTQKLIETYCAVVTVALRIDAEERAKQLDHPIRLDITRTVVKAAEVVDTYDGLRRRAETACGAEIRAPKLELPRCWTAFLDNESARVFAIANEIVTD